MTPTRLVADIGGTNARFALLQNSTLTDEVVLACADYPDLVAATEHYLSMVGAVAGPRRPVEAAIAIAGPVTGDIVRMTNHAWQFSTAQTRQRLGWKRFIVLNDFTALAMALRHLPAADLDKVGGGKPVPNAPIALIGPGTGLGVSGLIPTGQATRQPTGQPTGQHWIPLQGEGGHVTFSVMNEREIAIFKQLHQRFAHVSAERAISGPGLLNLYDALCALEAVVPQVFSPIEVTRRARDGSCRICMETVNTFCALLGTMASNLVLTLGALGGVYVGGGIVPSLGALFTSSPFRDRFEDKGRFADYLARVPSYVIRTELPALIGLSCAFEEPGPRWEAE